MFSCEAVNDLTCAEFKAAICLLLNLFNCVEVNAAKVDVLTDDKSVLSIACNWVWSIELSCALVMTLSCALPKAVICALLMLASCVLLSAAISWVGMAAIWAVLRLAIWLPDKEASTVVVKLLMDCDDKACKAVVVRPFNLVAVTALSCAPLKAAN